MLRRKRSDVHQACLVQDSRVVDGRDVAGDELSGVLLVAGGRHRFSPRDEAASSLAARFAGLVREVAPEFAGRNQWRVAVLLRVSGKPAAVRQQKRQHLRTACRGWAFDAGRGRKSDDRGRMVSEARPVELGLGCSERCPGRDSNSRSPCGDADFKSAASTNSATRARRTAGPHAVVSPRPADHGGGCDGVQRRFDR
jgi:hypothetical protein